MAIFTDGSGCQSFRTPNVGVWSNITHQIHTLLLTHLPPVPHICVEELGQRCFRQWFVACSAPSHYLNQCWLIVNRSLRNKLQWTSNRNTKLFIHENAFENVACEMAAILSGEDELIIPSSHSQNFGHISCIWKIDVKIIHLKLTSSHSQQMMEV